MEGRCNVTQRYYELFKTTPESLETNVLHCVVPTLSVAEETKLT
jgi:hypothetical protein